MAHSFKNFLSNNSSIDFLDGLYYQKNLLRNRSFEEHYLSLREKEHRLYNDTTLAHLPQIDSNHSHAKEWRIRKRSADRLIQYFRSRKQNSILEIGCGNGWLINYIHSIIKADFCGVDVNEHELKQAVRIFGSKNQISFLYADILSGIFDEPVADVILLASAIQYFPDLKGLLNQLQKLLLPNGQIHILDSALYTEDDVIGARKRSERYFIDAGYPEMQKHYFHHTLEFFNTINCSVMYNPTSIWNRVSRTAHNDSPFPWIIIDKIDAVDGITKDTAYE